MAPWMEVCRRRPFRWRAMVVGILAISGCGVVAPHVETGRQPAASPSLARLVSGHDVQVVAVDGERPARREVLVPPGPHVVSLRSRWGEGMAMRVRDCEVSVVLRAGRVYHAAMVTNAACGSLSFGCEKRLHGLVDGEDPGQRWTCVPR